MKGREMTLERRRMRGDEDRQITTSEEGKHAEVDTETDGWRSRARRLTG